MKKEEKLAQPKKTLLVVLLVIIIVLQVYTALQVVSVKQQVAEVAAKTLNAIDDVNFALQSKR